MLNELKTTDIYPIRYDSLGGIAQGHAGGTILLPNGYGLNFAQNQLRPARFTLENSTFTTLILRPYDTPELAPTSDRPLNSFRWDYRRSNVTWNDLADIASELGAAPSATDFTANDVLQNSLQRQIPYYVTQLGKQPIHVLSGEHLDTIALRQNMAQEILRDPMDFHSPLAATPAGTPRFNPFE